MNFIRDRIERDKKSAGRKSGAVRPASKPERPSSKPARPKPYAASARKPAVKPPKLVKPARKPAPKPVRDNTHGRAVEDIRPVIRLRTVLIGLCALVLCMAGPLALVWKQSYINQVSIRLEGQAEKLKALNGEITSLKLEQTRLSAAPRIERVARGRGLEYPTSERMVIIDVGAPERQSGGGSGGSGGNGGFIARVKSFVLGGKS